MESELRVDLHIEELGDGDVIDEKTGALRRGQTAVIDKQGQVTVRFSRSKERVAYQGISVTDALQIVSGDGQQHDAGFLTVAGLIIDIYVNRRGKRSCAWFKLHPVTVTELIERNR